MLRALRQLVQAWWATLTGRLRGQPRHPDWNPAFEAVVRFLLLDWIETSSWDFPRLRAAADARPYPKKWVRKVKLTTAQLGGVPAVRFVARGGAKRGATVLFFHGGSYIFGSALTSHAELLARLASETGVEVVGLDYRLAPEDVYPAQLDDALAAFDALLDEGVPASSIVVGGDSAGGNLAVALGLRLRDRGGPVPRALALLSPWVDLEMPGASYHENERYDFGRRQELVRHARAFAGALALDDPRISVTNARLAGLVPCFVTYGEAELPRDDIAAFVEHLREAGVEVTEHVAPAMPHNAAFFADFHPSAHAALDALLEFVKTSMEKGVSGKATGPGDVECPP